MTSSSSVPQPEPESPPDHAGPRTLVIQGDVRMLERDIKEAKFRDWTIACDERVAIGGDGTAPEPLSYFASSIIFWEMSHIWRYAQIFKVTIDKYEAHITMNFGTQGSVLAQTVRASCDSIDIRYEIESADPPEKVAAVLRTSRNGCYVRQTIGKLELFRDTNILNGKPFNLDDYPPPARPG